MDPDEEQARKILKYAISVLKGEAYRAPWKIRKGDALDYKRELVKLDMGWYVEKLDHWINFYQKKENEQRRLDSQTCFKTGLEVLNESVTGEDTSEHDSGSGARGGRSLD